VGLDFNGDRKVWLVFGQCQIQQRDEPGQHYLEGRMLEGATDFDHDSPYAIRLPLVGLTYKNTNGEVIRFEVDPAVAAARNQHGVPQSEIEAQLRQIEGALETWPPFWPTPRAIGPF